MPKVSMRQVGLLACFLLIFLFVRVGYSIEPVVIEFLYYEPCSTCPGSQEYYDVYLHNSQVVNGIQRDYGSRVSVEWIYFFSEEGREKLDQHGINPPEFPDYMNAIVISYEVMVRGYANETRVREIVDSYLTPAATHDIAIINVEPSTTIAEVGERLNITVTVRNSGTETESFSVGVYCNGFLSGTLTVTSLSPNHTVPIIFVWDTINQTTGNYTIKAQAEQVANETNFDDNIYVYDGKIEIVHSSSSDSLTFIAILALAFSFGFFETFSPCLIILLSFVLSYTIGEERHFRGSYLRVMIFGIGFVFAALLLGIAFGLFFLSMPALQHSLTWIVCIFAVIFGLNLLGLLKAPFQTKPLIKKLVRKYVTYAGLFLLGFTFYFLDPCIAPIFIAMLPLLVHDVLPLILFVFCLGAIIPFVGIGIFAGSVSKLARVTYRQRFLIRTISGLILIGYALYLIIFYLLPKLVK